MSPSYKTQLALSGMATSVVLHLWLMCCMYSLCRLVGGPYQQQPYSSLAAAVSRAGASASAQQAQHAAEHVGSSAGTVQPGRLVEFKRGSEHLLGLVVKPGSKANWTVEDAS